MHWTKNSNNDELQNQQFKNYKLAKTHIICTEKIKRIHYINKSTCPSYAIYIKYSNIGFREQRCARKNM